MYPHRSVKTTAPGYVVANCKLASKVVRALSAPPISTADMHTYLAGIARSYNVQWTPEYRPSDV
jgi:hypothetical protein